MLVADSSKISPNGVSAAGIVSYSVPKIHKSGLEKQLAENIGKPINAALLQTISAQIENWYKQQGYPVVDVAFPEQNVSTGTVQAIVTEFRVGAVKVSGNQWFDDRAISSGIRLRPGDPINNDLLQQDMEWINNNPFRRVDAVLAKGSAPGTTDIDLQTQDRFPVRAFAGFDNSGIPVIGRDHWNLGFNWGNALWLDHQLSYQFTSSSDFWVRHGDVLNDPAQASFSGHSLSYSIPLPWRDRIDVFGSYERERPDIGSAFGQTGTSKQASFRYAMPFNFIKGLTQEFQVGYDYKSSNNDLQFGGQQVFGSSTEVNQFLLIYKGTLGDPYGQTTLENDLIYSPGNLTDGNSTAAFQQSGTSFAHALYTYDHIEATRITPLLWDTSWVMRAAGQISSGNLLPSEELGLGGADSVRGYDERAANGSEGFLVSEELRSPSFSLIKPLTGREVGDKAQLATFWDFGVVTDNQRQPDTPASTALQGIGVGIRYVIGQNFTLRSDYGWQLKALPNTGGANGQMEHIALTVSY